MKKSTVRDPMSNDAFLRRATLAHQAPIDEARAADAVKKGIPSVPAENVPFTPAGETEEYKRFIGWFRRRAETLGRTLAVVTGFAMPLNAVEQTTHRFEPKTHTETLRTEKEVVVEDAPGAPLEIPAGLQPKSVRIDASTVAVDFRQHRTGPGKEVVMPGETSHTQGHIEFGLGSVETTKMSKEELARLTADVRQTLDAAFAKYVKAGISPTLAVDHIDLHVTGTASPEGWRDVRGNQTLSDLRARETVKIMTQELARRGLENIPLSIQVAGKGAEGDLMEFNVLLRTKFGYHAHGQSVDALRDEADRICGAISSGNKGVLFAIDPQLGGHWEDVKKEYDREIASKRAANADVVVTTKNIRLQLDEKTTTEVKEFIRTIVELAPTKDVRTFYVTHPPGIPVELNPGEPDPLNVKQEPVPPEEKKVKQKPRAIPPLPPTRLPPRPPIITEPPPPPPPPPPQPTWKAKPQHPEPIVKELKQQTTRRPYGKQKGAGPRGRGGKISSR